MKNQSPHFSNSYVAGFEVAQGNLSQFLEEQSEGKNAKRSVARFWTQPVARPTRTK